MYTHSREIKSFFFSQYFSDGLRISIGVLVPSLILAQFNQLQLGLTLSLGAVCICGVDSPGPVIYKRNAMLVCNSMLLLVALITGYARLNVYTLGLEIAIFTFFFSMFTVYGVRATAIGTALLLVMVFMIGKALEPGQILKYSIALTCGGLWYMLLSMAFFTIRPYRAAQQALGENNVLKRATVNVAFADGRKSSYSTRPKWPYMSAATWLIIIQNWFRSRLK